MLRFRLHQLFIPSLRRYFLLLPKLDDSQVDFLAAHLEARGFRLKKRNDPGKWLATSRKQSILLDGRVGVARSEGDLLDALGPAIPDTLAQARELTHPSEDVGALYLSSRRSGTSSAFQFFPRMESLRTWTCLRRDGLCGLSPDEKEVLRSVLKIAPGSLGVRCVTTRPRPGSKTLQFGRNLYYESRLPVSEFISSLATIDSSTTDSATYLPKDSLFNLGRERPNSNISPEVTGEWCYLR